jgi:VTC domain
VLDTTIRLRIRTRERRYIVDDDAALERSLRAQGSPIEYVPGRSESEITAVYFDTAEGTWSRGLSPTKIRARSYGDPAYWWLELKRRQNERVDKWRRPLPAAELRRFGSDKRPAYCCDGTELVLAICCQF